MAYNLSKLRNDINSNWGKWSNGQRRAAMEMYQQMEQANAQEVAQKEQKKANNQAFITGAIGAVATPLAYAGGQYLANLGKAPAVANTVTQAGNVATNAAATGASTAAPAAAPVTEAAATGTTGGIGSTLASAAPWLAGGAMAYNAGRTIKDLNDQGVKPFSGDYTKEEVDSIADLPTLAGVRGFMPKELQKFGDYTNKINPMYIAAKALFGSGKNSDQVKRDRVRDMLEGQGFAKKQGKTHYLELADGSMADIGHETQKDASGKEFKNYNIDFNDELSKEALRFVNPLAHLFGGGDQKVSSDTAGILTNAFRSNANDINGVKANVMHFLQKKGLSTDDIKQGLQKLKDDGKINDQYFNVFSADLDQLMQGNDQGALRGDQVGQAPIKPVEPVNPVEQKQDITKPLDNKNIYQNQNDNFLKTLTTPLSTSPGLIDFGQSGMEQTPSFAKPAFIQNPMPPLATPQQQSASLVDLGQYAPPIKTTVRR